MTHTRTEVCCDTTCSNYNIAQVIELTAEEVAELEASAVKAQAEQAEREAEAQAKAEAKASAEAKLAALGLSADEIAALSK